MPMKVPHAIGTASSATVLAPAAGGELVVIAAVRPRLQLVEGEVWPLAVAAEGFVLYVAASCR